MAGIQGKPDFCQVNKMRARTNLFHFFENFFMPGIFGIKSVADAS